MKQVPVRDSARKAFVAMIKRENQMRGTWSRQSLKAHWTGACGGFADESLQRRWRDFEAGWNARQAPKGGE